MKRDNTKIIDQYLSGELSGAERVDFVKELEKNAELREELELQGDVNEVAARTNLRETVESVGKSYHLFQKMKWFISGVLIIATAMLVVYFSLDKNEPQEKNLNTKEEPELSEIKNTSEKHDESFDKIKHEKEVHNQTNELSKTQSNDDKITHEGTFDIEINESRKPINNQKTLTEGLIDGLPTEEFLWKGNDTVYISNKGVLISVPKGTILLNDQPYSRTAVLHWQEAVDGATIMKSGLSTMADDELLETQGMFSISVKSKSGELLEIDKEKGIYVQVPVDEYKQGMQLYDGVYDNDGIINWEKPIPLEKTPVPISMSELDFYPIGYEDTLNKLKLNQEKKYRDSLYLACEFIDKTKSKGDNFITERNEEPTNKSEEAELSQEGKRGLIPPINKKTSRGSGALKGKVVDENSREAISNAKILLFTDNEERVQRKTDNNGNFEFASLPSGRYALKVEYSNCEEYLTDNVEISEEKITFLDQIQLKGCHRKDYIPPSKVLSFWNKNFENTILATRDFEKRMRTIHSTCDEDLLDVYISNIDKPLYYSDSLAAIEKGYSSFESFFSERVGKVELDNAHLENLQNFYTDGIESLKEELKKQREIYRNQNKKFDQKLIKERVEQAIRARQMNEETLNQETGFNLKQDPVNNWAGQTLPISSSALIASKQLTRSVGFRINRNNSFKNIDRKVADATRSRRNFQGKFGENNIDVKYNDFSVKVEDHENYTQLFTYLLPDEFNSYQRLNGNSGVFSYRLNDDISYNIAILGFNQQGFFYHERTNINKGNFSDIKLESITEDEFKIRLAKLNKSRLDDPSPIYKDLAWLKLEKENYRTQKSRIQKEKLLQRIRKVVFLCTDDYLFGTVVSFPDQEAQFPGGATSMKSFLAENINYPEKAMNEGVQGKVFVEFVVEVDGSISNVRVIRGVSPEIDEEAVRVVRLLPKLSPAQMNGSSTRSLKRIRVNFELYR